MTSTSTTTPISVWLIDAHADFRKMVAWEINQIADLRCTHSFSTCEEALSALLAGPLPQVILCNVGLPGMGGIVGISAIKALSPSTHVIMLTVHDDPQKVLGAICVGASGNLLKDGSKKTLAAAIHELLQGGVPMDPRVARLVLKRFPRENVAPRDNYGLSGREKEVLELMSKDLVKKEIADRLGLSFHTVNNHLRSIYDKLHVHTRSGAVAKALGGELL